MRFAERSRRCSLLHLNLTERSPKPLASRAFRDTARSALEAGRHLPVHLHISRGRTRKHRTLRDDLKLLVALDLSVADRRTFHEVVDQVRHHKVLDTPGILVLRTLTHRVKPRLHGLLKYRRSISTLVHLTALYRIVDDLRHVIDEVFVARTTVLGLTGELVLVGAVEVDEALSKFFRRSRAKATPLIDSLPIVLQSLVAVLLGVDHRSTESRDSSGSEADGTQRRKSAIPHQTCCTCSCAKPA